MRTFATMLKNVTAGFFHSQRRQHLCRRADRGRGRKMPNGERSWKNIVTESKSPKPAETLDEFRGAYKYNLLDKNMRSFAAQVPVFSQRRPRGLLNIRRPGEPMTRSELLARSRRKERLILAARASPRISRIHADAGNAGRTGPRLPKHSYGPLLDVSRCHMRSYRGPNTEDKKEAPTARPPIFSGPPSLHGSSANSLNSRATWKVIAADMPLSLVIVYDGARKWGSIEESRKATTARRADENLSLPICCRLSNTPGCATPCGSPPTFITRPLTTL